MYTNIFVKSTTFLTPEECCLWLGRCGSLVAFVTLAFDKHWAFIFVILQFCDCVFTYSDVSKMTSRKHTYIILNPLNPTLYSKIGVYRGKHYFFLVSALST